MKVSFKRVKRLPTEDFSSWQRKLDKKATFGNARRRCGKFSWKRQCFAIGTRRGQEGCVALAITSLLPPIPLLSPPPMVRPAKRGQRGIGCPSPLSVLPQKKKKSRKSWQTELKLCRWNENFDGGLVVGTALPSGESGL